MNIREEIMEQFPDEEIIFLDPPETFDPAIVGVTVDGRVVYERAKIIDGFCVKGGMCRSNAEEHVSFNTERALPYMGERAPILLVYVTHPLPLENKRCRHG